MTTGSLQWEEEFPAMKTGFSLWELLHRENPVLALYGIAVQWVLYGENLYIRVSSTEPPSSFEIKSFMYIMQNLGLSKPLCTVQMMGWQKKRSGLVLFLLASMEPEILPEMIEWGTLCITDLFQNKSVAYF